MSICNYSFHFFDVVDIMTAAKNRAFSQLTHYVQFYNVIKMILKSNSTALHFQYYFFRACVLKGGK